MPQLDISNLGKFSPSLYPDKFLSEIKSQWDTMSKKTKKNPLLKTLLKDNIGRLFLVFISSLAVALFDSLNVVLYSQIVDNLDTNNNKDNNEIPLFSLSTCMILFFI